MSETIIRSLSETDSAIVQRWLRSYLEQHLRWWAEAYGDEPRTDIAHLVAREWDDLLSAGRDNEQYVGLVERGGTALGIVLASCGMERYLGIRIGVLGWLYVAEEARGQGISNLLMHAADRWMEAQGVKGRQVYVTNANPAAVKVYERFGYRAIDSRMLGPKPKV